MDPLKIKAAADELTAALPTLNADVAVQIASIDHVLQNFLAGVNHILDRIGVKS
jgi:hypothetical protein